MVAFVVVVVAVLVAFAVDLAAATHPLVVHIARHVILAHVVLVAVVFTQLLFTSEFYTHSNSLI